MENILNLKTYSKYINEITSGLILDNSLSDIIEDIKRWRNIQIKDFKTLLKKWITKK